MPKPFRYLEPTFFAGLFDDPLLLVRVRPTGRALLFDCGKMHHLAKRVYTSIDAIFISHAHMDHFMGMDSVIRHSHASPRTIDVFGPPGLAGRMANKFACYDWNLADTFWGNFRVNEVGANGRVTSTLYNGPEAFAATSEGERNGVLYGNRHLTVTATQCEHHIPVMAYRIDEGAAFVLDDHRMAVEGVRKGAWLKDMEKLFHDGVMERNPVRYPCEIGGSVEERLEPDAAALYQRIRKFEEPASIGYVTDVGYSGENLEQLAGLLEGVTLLVCECAFLASEQKKAELSRHLCTTQFNKLLERLRPRYVLPMHFSKTYQRGSAPLYEEIEPPPGVTVLKIPDRLTPRPIMEGEVPRPVEL
ncbi:ribonuclease Z [Geomonas subterranea]|uniref:MBL fold metallo-hydrolase n=1 Tax=Geomonas subterranea TaxID=2847989 RepID=A0ABX8LFZ2_9BACT|nr:MULTISPECIES: MBL fold metallo-hydrolase [Geomonas]QXE89590.1 MBL fold metallo-hydrolase [Geomonas subterranea]QXM08293.1 MBL fold metallo-hydrolase [Geomonas subterranea]